ncbi:hypothetical protein QFC20_005712, partial [Naganishia adeliensis]
NMYQGSKPNVSFSNSDATQPAAPPSPRSTTFAQPPATCSGPTIVPQATEYTLEDWIAFLQSQEYHDWYQRELASGVHYFLFHTYHHTHLFRRSYQAFDNLARSSTSRPPCTSASAAVPSAPRRSSTTPSTHSLAYPGFPGDVIPTCICSSSIVHPTSADLVFTSQAVSNTRAVTMSKKKGARYIRNSNGTSGSTKKTVKLPSAVPSPPSTAPGSVSESPPPDHLNEEAETVVFLDDPEDYDYIFDE